MLRGRRGSFIICALLRIWPAFPDNLYAMPRKKEKQGHLFGIGFDQDDELKRITRAPEFTLLGGSDETHERMLEEAQAFMEVLGKYGKKMEHLSKREYFEIVKKISKSPKTWFYFGK